jgi:glycosyltransferase involved in cell wall biosynthesis
MSPRVSVVIPHYNDLSNLDNCLSLLHDQTLARSEYEVIVADNNSVCGIDSVRNIAAARATVINAPTQGAGPARNAGVAAGRGAILAFIDSDCRPACDWLERGLAAVANSAIVGGDVVVEPQTPGHLTAVEAFEAVFAFRFEMYINRKGFTGSGNMFVHRTVFETVGGFKSGVSEDVEWCQRAARHGLQPVYDATVIVGHPARHTWAELQRKWRRTTREAFLLNVQRPYGRLRWFLRGFAVLASAIVHTPKLIASSRVSRYRDRLAAVPVLFGIRIFRFVEMNKLLFSDLIRRQPL